MELQVPRQIQHQADHVSALPSPLLHASRNPDLTSCTGLKVLIRLLETLNTSEFKKVQTWFVANQLHTDETTIRRAFVLLEELGYLERGERDGNGFTFRLREAESLNGPTPPGAPKVAA